MENYSFLITGSRAVYKKSGKTNVPVAVLGLEMMYDNFAQMLMNIAGDDCKVKVIRRTNSYDIAEKSNHFTHTENLIEIIDSPKKYC